MRHEAENSYRKCCLSVCRRNKRHHSMSCGGGKSIGELLLDFKKNAELTGSRLPPFQGLEKDRSMGLFLWH